MPESLTPVEKIVTAMLRDEVSDMIVGDLDDWKARTRFEEGDRVYLRCAFYESPRVNDYVWVVQDQTSVDLDITDAPEPDRGGNAVVECNVAARVNSEQIKLADPKIVDFNLADETSSELAARL